ncbi:MAG: Tad domain-containing protein [Coriobacteriia bacterium]|nr:Tad domain-containing protein [Coriobacteriia bacterium]
MSHFLRDDEGATIVTVAIMMVVLILFTALAVDVGYAYTVRRQLQTAADAAALAGCRVLADGGSEPEVLAEAEAYAANNASRPGDDLYVVDGTPETEVGIDFVQVTVAKDAPLFFGRILGSNSWLVRTSARAQIVYLTGSKGLVPWGVPIISANKVKVAIAGGPEIDLVDKGSGLWEKSLSVPGVAAQSGYPLDVIVYNSQTAYPDGTTDPAYVDGVPEPLRPAATIFVPPLGCPIHEVSLDQSVVTAGQDSWVELEVSADSQPTVRFDGKNFDMSGGGAPGLWILSLAVPESEGTIASYPMDVTADGYKVSSAAVLLVRRSTYPVLDVSVSGYDGTPGDLVTVSVQLHDYTYGERCELRVNGGGGEVGNFCALDLSAIYSPPKWRNPQDAPAEYDVTSVSGYVPPPYYYYLENQFPFVIEIGDTIWTLTGVLSGPSTEKALEVRFGDDVRTWEQYLAAVEAGNLGSRRIVFVPVLEKMQYVTGTTPLRVVNLASFYVEPESDIKGNDIVGRFLEYVIPSDAISETPIEGLNIRTVRLVPPQ